MNEASEYRYFLPHITPALSQSVQNIVLSAEQSMSLFSSPVQLTLYSPLVLVIFPRHDPVQKSAPIDQYNVLVCTVA